jgi:ABC-type Mn2+/Zn2+ transport system ATPase subunit
MNLSMTIHSIKGIEHEIIEIPVENGLYAIVGSNGTEKSIIMSCFLQFISSNGLRWALKQKDYNDQSYVEFVSSGRQNRWINKNGYWNVNPSQKSQIIHFNGTYEGSLFEGTEM